MEFIMFYQKKKPEQKHCFYSFVDFFLCAFQNRPILQMTCSISTPELLNSGFSVVLPVIIADLNQFDIQLK